MKILVLANSTRGLFGFRKELMEKFSEQKHQLFFSSPIDFPEDLAELRKFGEVYPAEIDRRGINPFVDYKLYRFYKRLIAEVKPDFVLTYTIKCNIYGCFAARRKRVKSFANITGLGTGFQNKYLRRLIVGLYKTALKKTEKVFFENADNLRTFGEYRIVPQTKFVLLHGAGVNLELFQYAPLPESDPIRFLYIGRIMKEKGVDEIFEAAEALKKENADCVFSILGFCEENYQDRIDDLVARKVIEYEGYRTDVRPFIEKSHCVLLPSYHEGMSNSVLESASMGRPLIVSDIPGCREAVRDGINGFLVRKQDSADLLKKLKQFMETDFETKTKFGLESRNIAEKVFDRKKVVEKTAAEIERSMEGKK